jgi:hypothetical protein
MAAVEAIAADAIMGRLDLTFKTGITIRPLAVGGGLEASRQAAAAAVVMNGVAVKTPSRWLLAIANRAKHAG